MFHPAVLVYLLPAVLFIAAQITVWVRKRRDPLPKPPPGERRPALAIEVLSANARWKIGLWFVTVAVYVVGLGRLLGAWYAWRFDGHTVLHSGPVLLLPLVFFPAIWTAQAITGAVLRRVHGKTYDDVMRDEWTRHGLADRHVPRTLSWAFAASCVLLLLGAFDHYTRFTTRALYVSPHWSLGEQVHPWSKLRAICIGRDRGGAPTGLLVFTFSDGYVWSQAGAFRFSEWAMTPDDTVAFAARAGELTGITPECLTR